jgi:O-acetyl-ADP-ribose deacetylase (regulator of RNase III)
MMNFGIGRAGGTTVIAIEGDITRQPVEAVVNPANGVLQHNDGIPAAMVRTGGRVIQEESDHWVLEHGPLDPGDAAVTTAGMLQASHVIHVVGPTYGETEDPDQVMAAAVGAGLDAVHSHGLLSVAIPVIASGNRGVHAQAATRAIVNAVAAWLEANPDTITDITLVGSSRTEARMFSKALEERLGT